MELRGLFGGEFKEIKNFVDLLSEPPLKHFLKSRVQDYFTRELCYGSQQGFYCERELTNISDLVRRLAYSREIYVLVEENSNPEQILSVLYPTVKQNVRVTSINSPYPMHLFRFVSNTYFLENSIATVYFSFAKSREHSWERIRKNVERLIEYAMDKCYYLPLHPGATMYKEVEDLFAERKEEKLYLVHGFGPPYKAKFHPRMVKALVNYIGVRDGWILDPFVGSGTMSVECTLMGLDSIGVDISPVCIEGHARPKISALKVRIEAFRKEMDHILSAMEAWQSTRSSRPKMTAFLRVLPKDADIPEEVKKLFPNKSRELVEIYGIKSIIREIADASIRSILTSALDKVTSEALGARTEKDVLELFEEEVELVFKNILAFNELRNRIEIKLGESQNFIGDVRDLRLEKTVNGIVTSPPYSTAVDYVRNDLPMLKIVHEWDIEELDRNMMGNPRFKDNEKEFLEEIEKGKPRFTKLPEEAKDIIRQLIESGRKNLGLRQYKFLRDMYDALLQMYKVLQKDAKCVIIIGNNHFKINDSTVEFQNAQYIYEMASSPDIGFEQQEIVPRRLLKTDYGAIQLEHILILRKP